MKCGGYGLCCKACDDAGIVATVPKPMTSGAKAEGHFGKQDFVYRTKEVACRCPARNLLTFRATTEQYSMIQMLAVPIARRTNH